MRAILLTALVLLFVAPPALAQAGLAGLPLPSLGQAAAGSPLAPDPQGTTGSDAAPTTEYDLRFVCPSTTETVGAPTPPAGAEPPSACPAYILDPEDVMAQPDMVVDPHTSDWIAFHALHGGPGLRLPTQDPLPTPHSRDNAVHQTHTEFWSKDGGVQWNDNRYYSRLNGMAEVFGEDNAMAADPAGKLTLASLYSYYEKAGDSPQFAVFLWSSPNRIDHPVQYDADYVVRFVGANITADSLHLAYDSGANQMVTMWRTVGPNGPRVHLEHNGGDQWTEWNASAQVGPCDTLSNPVALGKDLLFACAAGSDTNVWAVHPDWSVTDLGLAPIHGMTSLRLASAEKLRAGGLVLAAATAREGRTHAIVVWGVDQKDATTWGRPSDFGDSVTDVLNHPGATLVEAHLTALAVLSTSGTAHFLLQEQYTPVSAADSHVFSKSYGVVQSSGRFLGTFPIAYGQQQSAASAAPANVAGLGPGAYYDAHDSLVIVHGARGEERLLMAFGDYGYVRFGEVVEVAPPVPAFPPIAPVAAVPTLSVATSPVLVGAVAGTLSLAAASRIALARSKKAAEVQA